MPPTDTADAGAAEMGLTLAESFPVLESLTVVVREHADHLRFARRDLALEARWPRISASDLRR